MLHVCIYNGKLLSGFSRALPRPVMLLYRPVMSREKQPRFVSPSDVQEQRSRQPSGLAGRHGIEAFDLFCAYHLGITEDGDYRFQNVHQVARRFGTNAAVIKQLLADYALDSDTVIHSAFDLAGAQVDIMLAPEGISRVELARELYAAFQASPRNARNWNRELEDAARDNERVFGKR